MLSLYRDVLRTSRAADPAQREEIISWARADFRQNKNVEDEVMRVVFLFNISLFCLCFAGSDQDVAV